MKSMYFNPLGLSFLIYTWKRMEIICMGSFSFL